MTQNTALIAIAVTIISGLIIWALKSFIPWAVAHIRAWYNDRRERVQRAELGYQYGVENNELLRKVYAELQPNGRKSIRDAIDRLERYSVVNNHIIMSLATQQEVGVFIANAEGEIVRCNGSLLRMFRISHNDMLGNKWRAYIHPEDLPAVVSAWNAAIRDSYDFIMDYRAVRKDNKVIHIHVHAQAVTQANGETIAFAGIVSPKQLEAS